MYSRTGTRPRKGDSTHPSGVNRAAALSASPASRAIRYLRTACCMFCSAKSYRRAPSDSRSVALSCAFRKSVPRCQHGMHNVVSDVFTNSGALGMAHTRPSIADKRRIFRQLHDSGCFVIPNPWDVGSAVYLQSLGFKALATTSSGFAWAQGRPDNGLPRERVLEHLREMVDATDLPLNADFENGFAVDAGAGGESVRLAVAAGVAGLSIEDSTGRADAPLSQ